MPSHDLTPAWHRRSVPRSRPCPGGGGLRHGNPLQSVLDAPEVLLVHTVVAIPLVDKLRHVHPTSEALEPHTTVYELLEVNGLPSVLVDECEKRLDIRSVQLQGLEVRSHTRVLQIGPELVDGDRPVPVLVQVAEDDPQAIDEHRLLLHDILGGQVVVVLRTVNGVLTKDACDYVEDTEMHEAEVADESDNEPASHIAQRDGYLLPIDAACCCFEEREHASRHGAPKHQHRLRNFRHLVVAHPVECNSLCKDDAEEERDHGEEEQCPNQGLHCVDDLVHQSPQRSDESDHPSDTD
mmetsp:Transcript_123759/g.355394  ORF Transcript_123759/g.355394 Transcript_123759/m.355394 type:complete len:295 (-) Transcript_123759:719-1603(-)